MLIETLNLNQSVEINYIH